MNKEIVVSQCQGCTKIEGNICIAIKEPIYFWTKYGECFARKEIATGIAV